MSVILYNAGRIKTYENLKALAAAVGETEEYADNLWQQMMLDDELIEEFNYYVVNRTLLGKASCGEYSLLDLYFSQMNKYNMYHDMGKNPASCNKERMVLHAFEELLNMRRDPLYRENYERKEDSGNDKL